MSVTENSEVLSLTILVDEALKQLQKQYLKLLKKYLVLLLTLLITKTWLSQDQNLELLLHVNIHLQLQYILLYSITSNLWCCHVITLQLLSGMTLVFNMFQLLPVNVSTCVSVRNTVHI